MVSMTSKENNCHWIKRNFPWQTNNLLKDTRQIIRINNSLVDEKLVMVIKTITNPDEFQKDLMMLSE